MRKRILHSSAILVSSFSSLLPHAQAETFETTPYAKKLRDSALSPSSLSIPKPLGLSDPPKRTNERTPERGADRYPWRESIVTTTFWVGEKPSRRNPVPNSTSSWDPSWAANYGGTDEPEASRRAHYIPANFIPQQNPFYVALPYNDVTRGTTKPEASQVIPWFKQAFQGPGKTVLKGRWLAIRFRDKVCYAQWEDCGPFRTDHWQYVFGNERPKPNLNRGAGLDVSPAVRDFLGMADTDVTDWKFVDFEEIPNGPWASYGNNNTFVMNQRKGGTSVVSTKKEVPGLR